MTSRHAILQVCALVHSSSNVILDGYGPPSHQPSNLSSVPTLLTSGRPNTDHSGPDMGFGGAADEPATE